MKKSCLVYMLVFLLIFMVGCSSHPTMRSIAGTYKNDLMSRELTIKKDGTFYETGFNGTCEIDGSKLIMRAGSLSVVYEITKHDGYYVLESEYVTYIPAQHYDDYMSEQLKAQQEAEIERQEEINQHQLSGQYILLDTDQDFLCFVELFDDWLFTSMNINPLWPNVPTDLTEKVFFSVVDDFELVYYNNNDIASWQYDSSAQAFVDGTGTQIPYTVYWYAPNNLARFPFEYVVNTSIYYIGTGNFTLQENGELVDKDGQRMIPTQFIYQFNV